MRKAGSNIQDVIKDSMKLGRPVTISYIRADGTETVRTIEAYEIKQTRVGATIVRAMDRQSGEIRSWRIDRITHYTVHRSSYTVPNPYLLRLAA